MLFRKLVCFVQREVGDDAVIYRLLHAIMFGSVRLDRDLIEERINGKTNLPSRSTRERARGKNSPRENDPYTARGI